MPVLLPWAHALESILYFYAVSGLIRYMLGDMRVTTDELVSAATTFTLLAWAFAYAFSACQAWVPGSFSEVSVPPQPRTWLELLFLSFSTLSGVGLTYIVPLSPLARALPLWSMFSGELSLALSVSRVTTLQVWRQQH